MEFRTLTAALGVAGVLLAGKAAWADSECEDANDAVHAAYFRKGRTAEATRKWRDAYFYYQAAAACGVEEYAQARRKLGKTLGALAEKEKRFGFDRNLFDTRPDAECEGWARRNEKRGDEGGDLPEPGPPGGCTSDGLAHVTRKDAGAFAWYEDAALYADADRVAFALVQGGTEDKRLFGRVVDHFRRRQSSPPEGYRSDPKYLSKLDALASGAGEKAFAAESGEFARKEVDLAGGGGPVERSLALLREAREWFDIFKDAKDKKLSERAVQRGDLMAKDTDSYQSLAQAIAYYEFAAREDKQKAVRAQARKMGEAKEKAGEPGAAAEYYGVAGEGAKAREMGPMMESGARGQAEETRKKVKGAKGSPEGMEKSEGERKKFKKEQEDLEKDLGF